VTNTDSSVATATNIDSETAVQSAQKTDNNSMGEFYQLRDSLLIGTVTITLISFLLVWYFYSLNISLSYLLGACCSLVYVNMLAREVERVGTFKRRIGSTRLALFVILMIVATQWQQIQVIPVFLGFMTYKASILFYVLPTSLLPKENKKANPRNKSEDSY
jgi:ATP synthase protein I